MTINEAWRNRGLLVPEIGKPFYRVTYGFSKYDKQTVVFQTDSWQQAKEQLTEKWREYAQRNGIRENMVLDLHCVPEPGK